MASSLASQLQKIAANSTNTLNTQKLKSLHSVSLLFPASHAATQDLDTVYSTALEGFRELCLLDERFAVFQRGLFSESSKAVDRFLLTRKEVEELDKSIEAFLQLVGGRLLLKPALKAVEWLVRRFRIQEQNTTALILAFLPYHSHPTLFPTVLSVIPQKNIPRGFLFLIPYLKPAAPLPRHVVTHALSHRRDFFNILSEYVLSAIKARRDHHALVSFFSGVTTESVSLMCDATRATGKKGLSEEDVLQRSLSILEEGFKARKSPEFQIGCYMLTTVLVSKLDVADELLLSLMQGIVAGWGKESLNAGLACLALLAQARIGEKSVRLLDEVVKALIRVEDIIEKLAKMGEKYRVDKLVVGLCVGVLERLGKKYGVKELSLVVKMFETARLVPKQQKTVMQKFVDVAQKIGTVEDAEEEEGDARETLAECLVRWSEQGEKKKFGKLLKEALDRENVDVEMLELKLQTVIRLAQIQAPATKKSSVKAIEAQLEDQPESFDDMIASLPTSTDEVSFLAPAPSALFVRLSQVFVKAVASANDLEKLFSLPLLALKGSEDVLGLSLLVKIWTSHPFPVLARTTALKQAGKIIKDGLASGSLAKIDYQALIPHVLAALADPAEKVRREAAALFLSIHNCYKAIVSSGEGKRRKSKTGEIVNFWGMDSIYGTGKETQDVKWLETVEIRKVIETILIDRLEECILDVSFIGRLLETGLSSTSSPGSLGAMSPGPQKDGSSGLRTSVKTSTIAYLSSHIANAPGLLFKLRILTMINRIEKASTSRTKFLLPVLQSWIARETEERVRSCEDERVDLKAFEEQIVGVVSEGDKGEGFAALIGILENTSGDGIIAATARRIAKIWNSLRPETQKTTAESLLEIALKEKDERASAGEALETIRNVKLPTEVFEAFFEKVRAQLKASISEGAAGKPKRRRTSVGLILSADKDEDITAAVKRVTIVTELLEGQGAEKHPSLLKSLFGVLGDAVNIEFSGVTYLQGVILSCMGSIVKSYKTTQSFTVDDSVRADVIVSCIRSTTSPQVQNSALLLLASLADVAPEVVKHSVMPIFTFMGANTLRQDDEYSAHVIEQTVRRIIPPLVKSLQEQGGSPAIGAAELVATFVASYRHIPAHRRVRLFIALTETLGEDEFLFAVLAKLAVKYNVVGQAVEDGNVREFCSVLAGSFGAEIQMLTVGKYLEIVLECLGLQEGTVAKHIFEGAEETKDASATELGKRLLQVISAVMSGERLKAKVVGSLRSGDMDAVRLRDYFSKALEKTLALGEKYGTAKGSEIGSEVGRLLENLLDLLSTPEFVNVIESLIDGPESKFRRSALATFRERVIAEFRTDAAGRKAVLRLTPKIANIITSESQDELKADALSCIDAVTLKYGKQEPAAISKLTEAVISDGGLKSSDDGLRVLALVCLTSMTSILGGRIVPVLPKTVPFALDQLRASIMEETTHEMIHNAVLAFLEEMVKNVPSFMNSYLPRTLPLLYASAESEDLDEDVPREIRNDVLSIIAEKMDAKVVMTAIVGTWSEAVNEGAEAVREVFSVVEKVLAKSTKGTVQKMNTVLLQFFLEAFELRRKGEFDEEDVEELEAIALDAALNMVLKLNDTIFKPMFLRIGEWGSEELKGVDEVGRKRRLVVVWNFMGKLCERLKSLVTEYYGYTLDNAVQVLQSDDVDEESDALWRAVLKSLLTGFSNDERDFWQSPTHFDKIADPLLSQLSHADSRPVDEFVIPAIVELAHVAQSEEHVKFINSKILTHMRADEPKIRLAAVRLLMAIYKRMGEDWLQLLPETVPSIAELMEDDDEVVERETHRLIKVVEEVLGEGELEAMLT
ncbi:snoRNA-binding rRNA-processing protein utp10 [Rhizina undulata]